MDFIPISDSERQEMCSILGISSIEELLSDIPKEKRSHQVLGLAKALSELELKHSMQDLAKKNCAVDDHSCFLGAGAYDHFIPAVVSSLINRSEFLTAYTPYQPEISQGTLQSIFEFQSIICELTGMDVANASLYDGATSLYEAAHMACQVTGRNKILVAGTVHPEYRQVLRTYMNNTQTEIREVPYADGVGDLNALEELVDEKTAAVIIQQPNFFGCLEPVESIQKLCKAHGALFVMSIYPFSLGLLRRPGDYGADIVTGEGQSLGLPLSFGGPYLGLFACRKELVRKMPGRVVGQTVDHSGEKAYVLTLQTREQHIRRHRATSNICSNEALCALAACIYVSLMGSKGLRKAAQRSVSGAHYLAERIGAVAGWEIVFKQPFFNEFVVKAPLEVSLLNKKLLKRKILGGLNIETFYPDLKQTMLLCVTEKRSKQELDAFIEVIKTI